MNKQEYPFFALGDLLRKIRTSVKKSHEEVSGAVEIELEHLKSIEQGASRPSEEVLLMLIQHYNVSDDHAERLWKLAGYAGEPDIEDYLNGTMDDETDLPFDSGLPAGFQQLPNVISMGISVTDPRIVYTDLAKVEINDFGVVMNFHQLAGSPDSKPLAVAKVGMSREHAERIITLLQNTLKTYDDQKRVSQKTLQDKKVPENNNISSEKSKKQK